MKITSTIIFIFSTCGLFAQTFNFKALSTRSYSVGSANSYENPPLKTPIIITFKNNVLSAIRSDGKKWMKDIQVRKIIPFNKASGRGVIEEYFLEYIDDKGFTVYATYKKAAPGLVSDEIEESLVIPMTVEAGYYAFMYEEFLSFL
jgi:hypothetical protein